MKTLFRALFIICSMFVLVAIIEKETIYNWFYIVYGIIIGEVSYEWVFKHNDK